MAEAVGFSRILFTNKQLASELAEIAKLYSSIAELDFDYYCRLANLAIAEPKAKLRELASGSVFVPVEPVYEYQAISSAHRSVKATDPSPGNFWSTDFGRRCLEENKQAVQRGVKITRVFQLDSSTPSPESLSVLREQREAGITVLVVKPGRLQREYMIVDDRILVEPQRGDEGRYSNDRIIVNPEQVRSALAEFDSLAHVGKTIDRCPSPVSPTERTIDGTDYRPSPPRTGPTGRSPPTQICRHGRHRERASPHALHPGNGTHILVSLTSVEDDALGEELQVVWEMKPGAQVYRPARPCHRPKASIPRAGSMLSSTRPAGARSRPQHQHPASPLPQWRGHRGRLFHLHEIVAIQPRVRRVVCFVKLVAGRLTTNPRVCKECGAAQDGDARKQGSVEVCQIAKESSDQRLFSDKRQIRFVAKNWRTCQ